MEASRLRASVQSFHTPVVVVSGSTEAEAIVAKNGLQLVDLFRPYATFPDLKLTISTVENTLPLRRFRLCFRTLHGLSASSSEVADAALASTFMTSPEQESSEVSQILTHKSDVTQRFQDTRDATPWFQQYQRSFSEQLRLSPHEFFNQPVACVLVLPSTAPDPINQFVAQFEAVKQSQLYQEGFMDTNIFKFHLLIHDPHGDPPVRDPESTFKEMQQAFGMAHCRSIEINSIHPDEAKGRVDIWTGLRPLDKSDRSERATEAANRANLAQQDSTHRESLTNLDSPIAASGAARAAEALVDDPVQSPAGTTSVTTSGIPVGARLSDDNLSSIQVVTRDLALKGIIPHLERRVRALHQEIANRRKGVMKQLKLWWRKPRNSTGGGEGSRGRESSDGSVFYEYGSMESQIRQLADYAYFLQDYELALSNYRMVAGDYKNDKALKHHAGALEMIGICLYLTDGSKRESETNLESAYFNYTRAGGASRYANRLTGILYDVHRSRGQWREAAAALLRAATEETSLRAALLTEQAAFSFLAMRRYRKYAFHLILAGHRYNQSGQRKHALRCYCAALDIYEGKNWSHIEDHVHFTLGRVTAHLHHLGTAINFFLRLLTHHQQPAERQTTFLREFVYVFKAYKGTSEDKMIPDLALPVFNDQSIRVVLNHQGGHQIDTQAESEDDGTWSKLEEQFTAKKGNKPVYRWEKQNTAPTPNFCVVGESVYVDVTLRNPLQIPVEIDNMCLAAELKPKANGDAKPEGGEEEAAADTAKPFEVDTISLNLEPTEERQIRLHIKPLVQGDLNITGVQWRLSGVIDGRHEFKLKGKRLNHTKKQRLDVVYAPDFRLSIRVTGPMPLLEVQAHQFPQSCVQGELCKMTLELTNHGQTPVKSIRLALSQPGFLCLGSDNELNDGFSDTPVTASSALEFDEPARARLARHDVSEEGVSPVIDLPTQHVGPLVPGHTALIPVWFYARQTGQHRFRMLFSYTGESTEGSDPEMKHRLFRLQATCTIAPSLVLSSKAYPSPTSLGDYILKVSASCVSTTSQSPFTLGQLTCMSPGWTMAPLSPQHDPITLSGREAMTTFYRVSRTDATPPPMPEEGEEVAVLPVSHSHCIYTSSDPNGTGTGGEGKAAVDSRQTPYLDALIMDEAANHHVAEQARLRARSRSVTSKGMAFFGDMAAKQAAAAAKKGETAPPSFLQDLNALALQLHWTTTTVAEGEGGDGNAAAAEGEGAPVNTASRIGVHHLPQVRISGSDAQDVPLKFTLTCPSEVSHDFSDGSVCVVPVTLEIKNCHPDRIPATDVKFEAFAPEEADYNDVSLRKSLYFWSGRVTQAIPDIAPQKSVTVPLQVCFVQAGVYSVHRHRVSAYFDVAGLTLTHRFPQMITIVDASGDVGDSAAR